MLSGRGSRVLLLMAAFVVVAAGIKLAKAVLVPLLLAAFLATVTAPLALWLRHRRVPAGIAVALALLIDIGAIVVLVAVGARAVVGFDERLPFYVEKVTAWTVDTGQWLERWGITQAQIRATISPGALVELGGSVFRNVAGLLSNLLLVVLIVVFMLSEALGMRTKLLRVMAGSAEVARLSQAAHEVNKYLAVKTLSSAVTGVLCGGWCAFIGLDFPILWGFVAFLLNFIPTIGSIVASLPPIALALVLLGPGAAVAVGLGYLAVNVSIGNLIEPRVLGRTLGISPLTVFLSVVLWGWLLGPVGALLSVPLTMFVKIGLDQSDDLRWIGVLIGPEGAEDEP